MRCDAPNAIAWESKQAISGNASAAPGPRLVLMGVLALLVYLICPMMVMPVLAPKV